METKKPEIFYGYIVVVAAFVIYVVMGGAFSTFGVFFKPMIAEFGWTRAMTSGAYSLNALMYGLLGIIAGRLNDKLGPRIIMIVCGILMGLGYVLMSQLSVIWQLYLFYGVIIAAGMGAIYVPLLSTVARWFVKRRGLITGIVVSGIGLGTAIVPPIASRLIVAYGWRTSYVIIGIIAFVLTTVAAQFLKRDPSVLELSPYGTNEAKMDSPNLDVGGFTLPEAIRTGQFWLLFFILFCAFFSVDSIIVHIVPHTTDLGISATTAANILAITGGLNVAGRLAVGWASDRIGNKPALIISFTLMSMVLFWLLTAKQVWALSLFGAVYGFSYGGIAVLLSPIVAWLFGLRSHGVILGVAIFGATMGSMLGPFLTGLIFDTTNSYQVAFLIVAIMSTLGLLLTISLGGIPKVKHGRT